MMINTNISDNTLALFGKSAEQSGDKPTIKTDGLVQAANAAKYAPTTSTSPATPTDEGPRDAASSYRPKLDVEMPGHYADPRAASGTGTEHAAPAYDGPSYTERAAGGSLLETVMADLEAVKNNQLADMEADYTARVEATLGRSLTEGESAIDFHTHAVLHRDDFALGTDVRSMKSSLGGLSKQVSGEYEVRSGMTLEGRTEDERIAEILDREADHALQTINVSIRKANEATANGYGENTELLPTLNEAETEVLKVSTAA